MKKLINVKAFVLMLIVIMTFTMAAPQNNISYGEDNIKYEFRDDFNDFNSNYWTVVDKNGLDMNALDVSNGILTLTAKKTDNYPTLISKGIPIEMGDKLIIKRRTYAHPEHDQFAPSAYVTEEDSDSWNNDRNRDYNILLFFQHLYFTYDKGRYPESLTKGNFGYARLDGFSKVNELSKENYGITRSTLDEWVDEEFIYDTVSGDVTITSGGETMNFKGRPLEKSYVRFHMVPYGWYTGQYDQMDWIDIKVVSASSTSTPPDNNERGTLKGIVLAANGVDKASGVTVNLISSGQTVQSVTTDASGEYTFLAPAGEYDLTINKSGFVGANYKSIKNTSSQTTYLETILQVPKGSGKGSVAGEIFNALTGNLEAGVLIEVRKGINNTSGSAQSIINATSSGNYKFQGEAGYYTFQTKKEGFIDKVFSFSIQGGIDKSLSDVAISPVLASDQIRIVLRWNTSPRDLDSHLIGPVSNNRKAHVYFEEAKYRMDSTSITLDVDDTNGEGPETITLTKASNGLYSYYVHDFTNAGKTNSNALANSMASVEVYVGNQAAKVFNVPNKEGTLWKVFTYDGISVNPVNNMTYHKNERTIE